MAALFNDVIAGGDGSDRIDAEGGLDTITLGAGTDTVVYDAAADSSGSLKDVITDFNQSTVNATTGVTATPGDNIEINFGTLSSATTWTLSDKGDVDNGGLAAAAIDGVMGSFVYAKDTSTIYLDYNGDGFLNTADLQITLTGLDKFHSNDINAVVTASNTASTLTGGNGDDTITGGTAADKLYGGIGNDTINSGNGTTVSSLYGGAGNDTLSNGTGSGASKLFGEAGNDTLVLGNSDGELSLTGGTGDDTFDATGVSTAQTQTIHDFESVGAVVGDVIKIENDLTTATTANGLAPVVHQLSTAVAAADTTVDISAAGAIDLLEITATDTGGTLANDVANGTQLLTDIMNTITEGITAHANGAKFYILAYDADNAYLYYANAGANAVVLAAEILPIAVIDTTADIKWLKNSYMLVADI